MISVVTPIPDLNLHPEKYQFMSARPSDSGRAIDFAGFSLLNAHLVGKSFGDDTQARAWADRSSSDLRSRRHPFFLDAAVARKKRKKKHVRRKENKGHGEAFTYMLCATVMF